MARVELDPTYREELSYILLDRCGHDADHTELRRVAAQLFPELAGPLNASGLASIIGHAATIRARSAATREERDVTDVRLEMTATDPLAYPPSYGDLDDGLRSTLIAFCERELANGNDGPAALSNLLRLHGWPYSERTFYVGPWKAARLRRRRRQDQD